MIKKLKIMAQEKALEYLSGIKKADQRPATDEEVHEFWEAFYEATPERRGEVITIFETFFPDTIPPDVIDEMKKRQYEKGFC